MAETTSEAKADRRMAKTEDVITVGDWLERLSGYPRDWRVKVSTPAGGGIAIEHREIGGEPVVAIFGSNGGRFGENPLTEEEYLRQSGDFLWKLEHGYLYTGLHGDHRLYFPHGGVNDTVYGQHYDERVVDRMVGEGVLEYYKIPYSRDGVRLREDCGEIFSHG